MSTILGTEHQDQEGIAPYLVESPKYNPNFTAEPIKSSIEDARTEVTTQYSSQYESKAEKPVTKETVSSEELCRIVGETAAWVIYARNEELNNNFRSAA